MINTSISRTPYQGLKQIFAYNLPFYLKTIAGITIVVLFSMFVTRELRDLLLSTTAMAAFWICSSLLVSHFIYDRSGLYRLDWVRDCVSSAPMRWIILHAGLDEFSGSIRSMFPGSTGKVIDIYDPAEMTEPSIRRARLLSGVPSRSASGQQLSASDQEFDAVFVMFAAHELRKDQARVRLFREIARVLRDGGEVVLVEHLRDWANFFAFGPGFLHFFPARAWREAVGAAGLRVTVRRSITPFVHVFVLQKLL